MNPSKGFRDYGVIFALLALTAFGPISLYLFRGISFYTLHALSGLMAIKFQIAQAFAAGEYPLWNPFMICGAPFHSGIGIMDPFLIPLRFLSPADGLVASAYLALLTAGAGMTLYLRRIWKLSFPASLLGGILYLTCPFFASTSPEQPFMAAPVYLPFAVLAYESFRRTRTPWKLLASAFALSLSFFSGNLESFYFVLLYFFLIQAGQILLECIQIKSSKPLTREIAPAILCGVFTFGFMAVDLFPTVEMIFYSARNANANIFQNLANAALVFSLSLLFAAAPLPKKAGGWLAAGVFALFAVQAVWSPLSLQFNRNLFYPNPKMLFLDGNESFYLLHQMLPVAQDVLRSWMDPRFIFYVQPPIYLFTLSTLVLFSLTLGFTSNTYLRFLGALAVLLTLFAYTSFPNLNVYILHLDQIAYPRIMFAFFFALSLLVSYGFHHAMLASNSLPASYRKRIQIGAYLACAGLVVYLMLLAFSPDPGRLRQLFLQFHHMPGVSSDWIPRSLLHGQITLEVLRYFGSLDRGVILFGAVKYFAVIVLALAVLKPKSLYPSFCVALLAADVVLGWNFYAFQKDDIKFIREPSPEVRFLERLGSDERVGTRDDQAVDLWNFYEFNRETDLRWNLPFFWNKRTIEGATLNLSPRLFRPFWELEKGNSYTPTVLNRPVSRVYDLMGMTYLLTPEKVSEPSLQEIQKGDRYWIYKNQNALPRFYFSQSLRTIEAKEADLWVHDSSWDPRGTTLLESEIPQDWSPANSAVAAPSVIIEKDSYNELILKANSIRTEFLATTDAYHPHWRAELDGVPAEIIKTNFYFRGLFLPPGEHHVRFFYRPMSYVWGGMVTGSVWLLFLFSFFLKRGASLKESLYAKR